MSRPVQWPDRVTLFPGFMQAGDCYRALRITRQTAANWRARYAMPAPDRRRRIDSRALALWLSDRAKCQITWG